MTKVGILNVTGYAGSELARILHNHPEVEISCVTGRSAVGQRLGDVFPHLRELDIVIKPDIVESVDLVFSGLPHKASAEKIIPLVEAGVKVVDISADFRLKEVKEYESWYKVAHPCPEYLTEAIYGLTEINRKDIAKSRLIANPGCYSTSAILAMAPAVSEGLIQPDIIVDGKSGVSGAGRGLSLNTHFSEVNENLKAYSVDGHRHLPEMIQELSGLSINPISITFLTHLVPMTRGILNSCYATLNANVFGSGGDADQMIKELYRNFYKAESFVKICEEPPQTKQTWGSNLCLIYPTVDVRTGKLIVLSCLDNLIKGAAGQAVQNMNLILGLSETTGLEALAIYP